MTDLLKSHKLSGVCYDIRGPVLDHANWLEDQGQSIIKLNIPPPKRIDSSHPLSLSSIKVFAVVLLIKIFLNISRFLTFFRRFDCKFVTSNIVATKRWHRR